MNLDTLYTANRIDHGMQPARLERVRQTRDAVDGAHHASRIAVRIGVILIRAGSRLQGLPEVQLPAATPLPDPA